MVRKSLLLYTALVLIALLAVLHFIAGAFYFYWTIWWYDLMTHTLGGFIGALVILWFIKSQDNFKTFLITLGCLIAVGIVWEVFEYIYDIAALTDYWQDTFSDLAFDGLGAIAACLYAMRVLNPKSVSELTVR